MSEPHPRKPRTLLSPFPLALLITVVTIAVLGGLYLLRVGMNAPSPVQTGTPVINTNRQDEQVVIHDGTPSPLEVTPKPVDPRTIVPVVEFTEVPHVLNPTPITPGPTAQFETIPPLDQWKTYVDAKDNFSIRYPPDWYVEPPVPERIAGGVRVIEFTSYDPKDMTHRGKGETPPDNLRELEIVTIDPATTGFPYLPDDTFLVWARRTHRMVEGMGPKLLDEQVISVAGREGLLRFIELDYITKTLFLPFGDRVMYIQHKYETPENITQQMLQMMIDSIEFH